jgi:hypothetical protein
MTSASESHVALAGALRALREPLPFAPVRLPPGRLEALDRFMQAWSEECGLGDERSREVVRVYLEHCSPRAADLRSVEMAAELLQWFFAITEAPDGADKRRALSGVRAILRGEDVEAAPFTVATRRFRDRILRSWPSSELYAAIEALLSALSWQIDHAGQTVRTEVYLEHRAHTAAVYPYLYIFRHGLGARDQGERDQDIATLEELSVQIVCLVNDILSVARDCRKNKHNVVFAIAADRGISQAAAVPFAVRYLFQKIDAFQALNDGLRSSRGHEEYSSFLASSLEGARAATLALRERYFGDG